MSEFPILLSYGPAQPQEQCPGRDYVSDSPCNISTMNEWGPGVNLPYYVKVGLEGTSIVVVVILVI